MPNTVSDADYFSISKASKRLLQFCSYIALLHDRRLHQLRIIVRQNRTHHTRFDLIRSSFGKFGIIGSYSLRQRYVSNIDILDGGHIVNGVLDAMVETLTSI